jgi:HAD superfamily hydrolase (TIGR01490 family)
MEAQTRPATKVAAFFDLDKTLVTANGGKLWMLREYRHGRISLWQVVRGLFYVLLYHFGIVDMDKAMGEAVSTLKGLDEADVRRRTEEWFAEEMAPKAAPGAPPVIDKHRAEGHLLVLHTGSSPYASKCAVELFGLDHFLSARFEVVDGLFTGNYIKPLCYAEGKVHYGRLFAKEHGVDLSQSYFYTDSLTDLPMLLAVGHPRIVNPDPRLRREAKRRGWPVLDWA